MAEITFFSGAWDAIKTIFQERAPAEDMAFAYATCLNLPGQMRYTVQAVILLDEDEAERTSYSVRPKPAINRAIYRTFMSERMADHRMVVITIHSHPFSDSANFSAVDFATIHSDRKEWDKLSPGNEFLWVVLNRDGSSFDAVVIYPDEIVPVERITIVGQTFESLERREATDETD